VTACDVLQLSGRGTRCLFQELQTPDHYTEFRSVSEPSWYVGFSRRGRRLRADSWLNHRRRHGRRRRQSADRCRQFIKTQVTVTDDDRQTSSSSEFNHQPVDFQRIYYRLRAQRHRHNQQTRRTWNIEQCPRLHCFFLSKFKIHVLPFFELTCQTTQKTLGLSQFQNDYFTDLSCHSSSLRTRSNR